MQNPVPRSLWVAENDQDAIYIIDQRYLPHQRVEIALNSLAACGSAIVDMQVRGAPLIGITAAFGMYFAFRDAVKNTGNFDQIIKEQADWLISQRPTAVNLQWAVEQMMQLAKTNSKAELPQKAWNKACALMEEDARVCKQIGEHALPILRKLAKEKEGQVNILTHCNAGSLACIEWGTATSPIYQAHQEGIDLHVWVDETRPRNQGAQLTAWELTQAGIKHHLIVDNAGGQLMQMGKVDICFVGTDRVARNGDVANKIGTYLKALAAHHNHIPFYVCLPSSTIDWQMPSGSEIPIETRHQDEVRLVQGKWQNEVVQVQICPDETPAHNYGFDITPAALVNGFITERGVCRATKKGLAELFKDRALNQ